MLQLTLSQLFGEGATQTTTNLIIKKSAFSRFYNQPEQLLAAIIAKAIYPFQGMVTDENNNPITDENNNTLTFDNGNLYYLNVEKWESVVIRQDKIVHTFLIYQFHEDQ